MSLLIVFKIVPIGSVIVISYFEHLFTVSKTLTALSTTNFKIISMRFTMQFKYVSKNQFQQVVD